MPRAGLALRSSGGSDDQRTLLRDFQCAATAAWMIVSAIVLAVLLAAFFLPESAIIQLSPLCESKARGEAPCPLCGMTTAFLLISDARFAEAHQVNRGGIPLYAAFVLNELFAFLFLGCTSKGGRLWRC